MAEAPPVPLTIEGSSVLHQMFAVRWSDWRENGSRSMLTEAAAALREMEAAGKNGSALYSLLGHKGDLMLVHFRPSFDDLEALQQEIRRWKLFDYLEPTASYVSVVELGLYESTQKVYGALLERGIEPHSDEWNVEIAETVKRQAAAMSPRLYPEIPPSKYLCFYPMDRRRGETKNWYTESMPDRSRMMHEHGLVGRRYAGEVRQIISGSIGFDDWEWGVDLFAEDPLVFKRLIYEMRFDEVSAVYALFGSFYIGRRYSADDLHTLFGR